MVWRSIKGDAPVTNGIPTRPFVFVRHGETAWNAENRIIGQEDIPLNSAGIAQAYKAGRLLKNTAISRIVHSSLLRCMSTASIITAHVCAKTFGHEGLREANMGVFQGQPKTPNCCYAQWARDAPPHAETFQDFHTRVISALTTVLSEEGRTLIVSHGGVFHILQQHLALPQFYLPFATPVLIHPCPNTQAWTFKVISDPFIDRADAPLSATPLQSTTMLSLTEI